MNQDQVAERVVERLKQAGWAVEEPHPMFRDCRKGDLAILISAEMLSAASLASPWTSMQSWVRIKEHFFVPLPGNAMGNTPSAEEQELIDIVLEEVKR